MAKINTVFSLTDNITNPLRRVQAQVEKTTGGFSNMAMKLLGVNQAIALVNIAVNGFRKATEIMNQLTSAYEYQAEQELKLETIMKQRMNASRADIQAIKDLASAQQQLGIYGDEVILQGAQELSSFTSNRKALELLIPAMNDLVAQQYGYSASGQQFQSTADMMGKVLSGQTGALSRMGYIFSEEEKAMLKAGDEMQRASTLAKIITDNVGHMNQALAKTDAGAIQNVTNAFGDMNERLGQSLISVKGSFSRIKMSVALYFEQPLIKAINLIKNNLGTLTATIINLGTITVLTAGTMAVAWAVANWPLTIVITLIGTLIRMMFNITSNVNQASEAMNGFGNACANAGAMFGYLIGFIGTVIGGALNIIYNVIATLYNAMETIVEYMANVFTHPIKAIQGLFINLATTIINVLEALASVVDWVFGTSWESSLAKASEALQQFKKDNIATNGYVTGMGGKAGLLELKKTIGIVQGTLTGGNIGKELGTIFDKNFSGIKIPESNLPNNLKTDGNGALIVSDINLVDIADDYRELLSKRATEKFNLQFSQVTPQVTVGDITLNNNADYDKFLYDLANTVDEAQSNSLAG